jgi:hypothetical protein
MIPVMKARWSGVLPVIHLTLCFLALSGYVLRSLQFLGILFSVLVVADFPVSLVYVFFAVSNHGVLAFTWLALAGTSWWYFLCRVVERIRVRYTAGKSR